MGRKLDSISHVHEQKINNDAVIYITEILEGMILLLWNI